MDEYIPVDLLASLTGSRVRADVLAALFGARARPWKTMELGRVTRRPHQLVSREVHRLVTAGVLRARIFDGKRHYEPDPDAPVARELVGLVRQTRGRIPRIRRVVVALRSRAIVWAVSGRVAEVAAKDNARARSILFVLTGAPKALVRVQLADVMPEDMELQCMSIREWIARLEKGDVLLRRARRARKLWILGRWEDLVARERATLEARRLLRSALTNWREELSDDWDEDWDPFAPAPGEA